MDTLTPTEIKECVNLLDVELPSCSLLMSVGAVNRTRALWKSTCSEPLSCLSSPYLVVSLLRIVIEHCTEVHGFFETCPGLFISLYFKASFTTPLYIFFKTHFTCALFSLLNPELLHPLK